MISVWWVVGVIFFWIIVIAIKIIFDIKTNNQTRLIDITPNAPKIDMTYRRQFTDGYTSGLVKTQRQNKNGTTYFEVYPDDGKQGKDIPLPPLQSFVVAERFIIRYAEGEKSSRRNKISILPRSKLDMPEKERKTLESNYLNTLSAKAFIEENIGMEVENTFKVIKKIHEERAGGELSNEHLALAREQQNQIRETFQAPQVEQKKEEKKI
jgi:hypothetical protein